MLCVRRSAARAVFKPRLLHLTWHWCCTSFQWYSAAARKAQRQKQLSRQCSKLERIYLVIDGDHIGPTSLKPILACMAGHGLVVKAKIYLKSFRTKLWSKQLDESGVEAVEVMNPVEGGHKDVVDMAITWDVRGAIGTNIDAVAIASQDSDYAILHHKVREAGLKTYAVIRHPVGPCSLSDNMRQSASSVVWYRREGTSRVVSTRLMCNFDKLLSTGVLVKDREVSRDDDTGIKEELAAHLLLHGFHYISENPCNTSVLLGALAKFYHVNQLGDMTVSPQHDAMLEGYAKLCSRPKSYWVGYPNNLSFIQPQRNPTYQERKLYGADSRASHVAVNGGPFLVKIVAGMSVDVLRRLGFADSDTDPLDSEHVELFCEVNSARVQSLGLATFGGCDSVLEELDNIFSVQGQEQKWKCVLPESSVRQRLVANRILPSAVCPKDALFDAMGKYLRDARGMRAAPRTFVARLVRTAQHLQRRHPDVRPPASR